MSPSEGVGSDPEPNPRPSTVQGILVAMHRNITELEAQLDHLVAAPADDGLIEMIVRRPQDGEREVVETADLDPDLGLIGDNWQKRGGDDPVNPLTQVTLMNSRVAQAVAGSRERWPLAGDQIYVDMDLGEENLPPGTRLHVGTATVEITSQPHTGCAKFSDRFGAQALRFVNIGPAKAHRLRGVYAQVIEGGRLEVGQRVRKA